MSSESTIPDINRYKIMSKIGEGGFSSVYRVKDLETSKYYAAKIANFMVDEDTQESTEAHLLFREVNLMSLLNHPAILKFIGYYQTNFENDPVPTIIVELAANGSLRDIIEAELSGLSPKDWDDTKKLINIYGIASGMAYLHANKVIHRDLKPDNILVDSYLHPKISDFGLSKLTDFLSVSMNFQSQKGLKGTPIYMAPEIYANEEYSTASDVYAFAFIVYEIMTGQEPFKNHSIMQIMNKVTKEGARPQIGDDLPDAYRELIETCWAQEPNERPSFDTIVESLKTNEEFITELTDENEFYDYVDFIDNYKTTFDFSKRAICFADFIKVHGRNKDVKAVNLKNIEDFDEINKQENQPDDDNQQDQISNINQQNQSNNQNQQNQLNNQTQQNQPSNQNQQNQIKNQNQQNQLNNQTQQNQQSNQNQQNQIKNQNQQNQQNNQQNQQSNQDQQNKQKQLNNQNQQSKKDQLNPQSNQNQQNMKDQQNQPSKKDQQSKHDRPNKKEGKHDKNEKEESKGKGKESNASSSTSKNDQETPSKRVPKIYPMDDFQLLSKECQALVLDANDDGEKQFIVAKSLIEGKNGFPQNSNLGLEYVRQSNKRKCLNTKLYSIKMLIKGDVMSQDLDQARRYISTLDASKELRVYLLNGLISLEEEKHSEAARYFKEGADKGCVECMYKYAKMLFLGERIKRNINEAVKYFKASSKQGYEKSNHFLSQLAIFNTIKEFAKLKADTQFFFIKNNVKVLMNSSTKHLENVEFSILKFKPDKTEKLFVNKDIKSADFIKILGKYNDAFIEIDYTSDQFNAMLELVLKLQAKKVKNLKIGIVFSSFDKKMTKSCFSKEISYHVIDPSVESIPSSAFRGCTLMTKLMIPYSVTSIGDNAFEGCQSLKQLVIPSSVTSIGNNAFRLCSSLADITIHSKIKSIGDNAFEGCQSLTQISIPSSVMTIGNNAFKGCSSLVKVSVPSSLVSVGESCFKDCSSLLQIAIPATVTRIGKSAFEGCSSLKQAKIPSSLSDIKESLFSGCNSLAQIEIPSSAKSIGDSAFVGCSSLKQIKVPSSVTHIGNYAFRKCISLAQISLPSSVTFIGSYALSGCSSLKQIVIPPYVNEISESCFNGCSQLASVLMPVSLKSIGRYAFKACTSLKEIKIPSSVTEIGSFAFEGCTSLTEISIPSHLLKSSIGIGQNVKVKKI